MMGEMGILTQIWPVVPLVIVLVYLDRIIIPKEEARLLEVFGDHYVQYRESVRRWL